MYATSNYLMNRRKERHGSDQWLDTPTNRLVKTCWFQIGRPKQRNKKCFQKIERERMQIVLAEL